MTAVERTCRGRRDDIDFVESFAAKTLAQSNVATVTAASLRRDGINAERLAELIERYSALPAAERRFELKKHLADPETPSEFAVLVRTANRTRGNDVNDRVR